MQKYFLIFKLHFLFFLHAFHLIITTVSIEDSEEKKKLNNLNALMKNPFLLIEDILEQQTVSEAKSTWEIVENLFDRLTAPMFIEKGKFSLLRFSNSLLRKLSKSCHTEFCGKILMYLASAYPISEKSALNLAGKINQINVTNFDSSEIFSETFEPSVLQVNSYV